MLHAITRGTGPTVLMLHSSGLSSRQWMALIELVSVRYRVVAPDLLGYGANPAITGETPYALADEVDALLELLGDERAHVVGHSFGGMVALMLARREPKRVCTLALFDPVAFGVLYDAHDADALPSLEALVGTPVFSDPRTGGSEDWLRLFIDYWSAGPAWDALPPASRQSFLRTGRKVFREVMQISNDRTPRRAYAAIEAPALLMTGERTPIAAQRTVQLLSTALVNAHVQTFAGAGHMGPITHAAQVNRAITAHIIRHS